MKIIVPMAGMGKRLRPHTLTVPKPLVKVAGKPIVQRLVEDLAAVSPEKVDEIAFIIGPSFGEAIENKLVKVAEALGAKGTIYYQEEALGTAHAILCAQNSMEGQVIVAFADTLFKADFELDQSGDGVLWVQQIDDPSAFGVVKINDEGVITDFVEKPQEYVSDLAMIGIYYFKDGANLKNELQFLIDNNVIKGGEYQLPDALRNMTEKGLKFKPGQVEEWLDCGNKEAVVYTNQRVLAMKPENNFVSSNVVLDRSVIIEPCYIGEGVTLKNSIVGPHVSITDNTQIEDSRIENSLIGSGTKVSHSVLRDSMVGDAVVLQGSPEKLSVGDYNQLIAK